VNAEVGDGGYAAAGVTMIPILALVAWVFQPDVADTATEKGWIVADEEPAAATPPADD